MLILTFEDSEEEILNHIISCVNTGARAFQVIENAKTNLSYGDIVILLDKRELFRKQKKIDLSFTEFEILHLLMHTATFRGHQGRVLRPDRAILSGQS